MQKNEGWLTAELSNEFAAAVDTNFAVNMLAVGLDCMRA